MEPAAWILYSWLSEMQENERAESGLSDNVVLKLSHCRLLEVLILRQLSGKMCKKQNKGRGSCLLTILYG